MSSIAPVWPKLPAASDTTVTGTPEYRSRLLLTREREVAELRHMRARAEDWLRSVHAMAPERLDVPAEQVMARVADLLVGELSFEIAAAFEHDEGGSLTIAVCDPLELPEDLSLGHEVAQSLHREPCGTAKVSEGHFLAEFAAKLDLTEFRWSSTASARNTRFLLVAGFSERTAQFHRLTEADQAHFSIFCNHATAILNNGLLFASVREDRRKLEEANRELDASLEKLRKAQTQLMESTRQVARASRQAGMAEVATGILHNVGNVLNSVNVCSDTALQRVERLPLAGLTQAVRLLGSQRDVVSFFRDDPRANTCLEYLCKCCDSLCQGGEGIRAELQQLQEHLAHVAAIISRQQTYARPNAVEPCDLAMLIEDALLLVRSGQAERSIEVVRDLEPLPPVHIDKHRVLQVLVNLITNAIQALSDADTEHKRLTARLRREEAFVAIQIEDTGIGIDPERAKQIFQHGYTTRKDGHGFGLHTSALTANELGGELLFQSPGANCGATFSLRLPLHTPTSEEA